MDASLARRCLVVLVSGLLLGLLPAVGNAYVLNRADGNDSKAPLDLASVRLSHSGRTQIFRFTTHNRVTDAQISNAIGWFRIGFDVDADRNYEKNIYVEFEHGRVHGDLTNASLHVIGSVPAARLSPTAFGVKVSLNALGSPKSYDFAIWSVYFGKPCSQAHACIDYIPNRYPLMRFDLTAPVISLGSLPKLSTDVSATLAFPVAFSVIDDANGTGVKSWTVQTRTAPATAWTNVQTGTGTSPVVNVTGTEGAWTDVRVIASDRQDNRVVSTTKSVFTPYDDGNAALTYAGTFAQSTAVAGAFLGTITSMDPGATTTVTVPGGAQVCFVLAPTVSNTATASVSLGGTDLSETPLTPYLTTVCRTVPGGSPIDVTVTASITNTTPFVVDGIAILP